MVDPEHPSEAPPAPAAGPPPGRTSSLRPPPETWAPARRVAEAIVRPLERFLHVEAASGIVLLIAATVAMVWANSPWKGSYDHLWHTPIAIRFGGFEFAESLHFWINDGLMVIFFFVVGLEIRREIHAGELSELRRAALPIAAAIGGMLVPALIYLAFNPGAETRHGWGVPMATDIAFAVGVLTLLGKRVPAALRVLLLALAIIDDIGAILVIAIFYSSGVQLAGLAIAAAGGALILLMQRIGLRRPLMYVVPSLVVWAGMLRAGVHPTIAGVIIGLMTPARSWFREQEFFEEAREALADFRAQSQYGLYTHDLVHTLDRLDRARREALAPVIRLEAALHPWVAFGIMPLFALANAGVTVGAVDLSAPGAFTIATGIVCGLAVGKLVGITGASLLAARSGLCALPRGVDWRGLLVVGSVGGIGFTMALFIAGLAFKSPINLGAAKLAVLVGSAMAGAAGLLIGRFMLATEVAPGAAPTADDAETSTEY